jgi:tRNA(Ile)-lysidine synthetase-like protein
MLRNRVRGSLLPVLEGEFPGWRRGLASLARKSARTAQMLRESSAAMGWRKTAAGFRLAAEEFFGFPAALRAASLMSLWDSLCRGRVPRRLPSRFLAPALGERPAGAGRTTLLAGHGVRLRLEGETVLWEADIASSAKKSYLMEANGPGSYEIRSAGIVVRIAREGPREAPAAAAADARILEHEVALPLVLRSRRAGDRVRLAHGTKTLKALLAEMKVPSGDRWMVPILADRKGVLAVLGGTAGCRTVVRRGAVAPRDGDSALAVRAKGQEGTSEQQF